MNEFSFIRRDAILMIVCKTNTGNL